MIRRFILEMPLTERNAICPRLVLLVCFASVFESQLQMKILPDDFISTRSLVLSPALHRLWLGRGRSGGHSVILNRQLTEACLTLNAPEIYC